MAKSQKNKTTNREYRSITGSVELTATEELPKITGYASIYEQESHDLGGFVEIIKQGAFDGADISDVRALFNHDANIVLGRSINESLNITVDEKGLYYEIVPPDTQTVRDLVIKPMQRGFITQSSFAFTVKEDDWYIDKNNRYIREIKQVDKVYDVSPVTYPAYENTASSLRSLDELKNKEIENQKLEKSYLERDLYLVNLK